MNSDERMWLNQNIFSYKDIQYGTGNSIDLGYSSSTQDFQIFSALSLNLSIFLENKTRKVFNINYQIAVDLTRAFKEGSKSNFTVFNIYRKHGDRSLKAEVHHVQDSQEIVCSITISYSSSDSTVIVLPMSVFFSLMCLIKDFSTYYLNLVFDFTSRYVLTELLKETKEVKSSIRHLPSFLKEVPMFKENSLKQDNLLGLPPGEPAPIDSTLTNDFDQFVDQNIDKIKIDEFEYPKQNIDQEYISPFIYKVLKQDISVLENLINSASVKMNNSILTFKEILNKNMAIENVDYLPGITQNELKSVLYMTKVFFGTSLFSFANKNSKVPRTVTVTKYQPNPKLVQSVNVDLAYDLLLISAYLRLMKNQLEPKLEDAVLSKAFLYLTVRCFTDVFIFSFLEGKDTETIKSCVLSRFTAYQKFEFFKKYEFVMENYGCKKIRKDDISVFLDDICSKVVGKGMFIKQLHEKNYEDGTFSIPFENTLSVEQIINEVVCLEIAKRVGIDINNAADLSRIVDPFAISEQVKELFKKERKPATKKRAEPEDKGTNLFRFANYFKTDIGSQQEAFLAYVKQLEYLKVDWNNKLFNLEELGESIVKGIYVWNELEDREKEKYTDFYLKYESCLLDKKLIISKVRSSIQELKEENWDIASNID